MEDMMKALLDVVRAQHTATEGSEERPFDINDIIDMALNITGRPEEPEEQQELSDTIQKLAESLAPDIFPPKTFEEMDDSEQAASAVNMIEERLRNGGRRRETAAPQSQQEMTPQQNSSQMQSESHEENPFAQVMEKKMRIFSNSQKLQMDMEIWHPQTVVRPKIMVMAVLTICLDKTM